MTRAISSPREIVVMNADGGKAQLLTSPDDRMLLLRYGSIVHGGWDADCVRAGR